MTKLRHQLDLITSFAIGGRLSDSTFLRQRFYGRLRQLQQVGVFTEQRDHGLPDIGDPPRATIPDQGCARAKILGEWIRRMARRTVVGSHNLV
jgi:hypothetical protein